MLGEKFHNSLSCAQVQKRGCLVCCIALAYTSQPLDGADKMLAAIGIVYFRGV